MAKKEDPRIAKLRKQAEHLAVLANPLDPKGVREQVRNIPINWDTNNELDPGDEGGAASFTPESELGKPEDEQKRTYARVLLKNKPEGAEVVRDTVAHEVGGHVVGNKRDKYDRSFMGKLMYGYTEDPKSPAEQHTATTMKSVESGGAALDKQQEDEFNTKRSKMSFLKRLISERMGDAPVLPSKSFNMETMIKNNPAYKGDGEIVDPTKPAKSDKKRRK